jgi:hypothetical protein
MSLLHKIFVLTSFKADCEIANLKKSDIHTHYFRQSCQLVNITDTS